MNGEARSPTGTLPKVHTVNLSQPPQKDLELLLGNCALSNGISRSLGGLPDTDSERTLLLVGDHCGPPVRVWTYGGQGINVGLAQICLAVGHLGSQTHLMVLPQSQNAYLQIYSAAGRISTCFPDL